MFNKNELIAVAKGYSITKDGEIISPFGKIKGCFHNGYNTFKIRVESKKSITIRVHRLQAYQKFGNKIYEQGIEVRHLDNVSINNSWANISIGTHSENMMDKPKEMRVKNAQKANLKYDKVAIREYHKEEKSYKKTMEKFGISGKGTLSDILNRVDI